MGTPSKRERDQRLDELSSAVSAWASRRRDYLNNQVAFSKRLLRQRVGSDRLQNASVSRASSLLVDEINQFLTGE